VQSELCDVIEWNVRNEAALECSIGFLLFCSTWTVTLIENADGCMEFWRQITHRKGKHGLGSAGRRSFCFCFC
jgi:hypothetical protein